MLFCRVGDAGYTDPAGNPVPETVFQGTGRAVIFTGTTVTEATWTKTALTSTLTFTAADGSPITVAPGKTFFELVPKSDGKVELG